MLLVLAIEGNSAVGQNTQIVALSASYRVVIVLDINSRLGFISPHSGLVFWRQLWASLIKCLHTLLSPMHTLDLFSNIKQNDQKHFSVPRIYLSIVACLPPSNLSTDVFESVPLLQTQLFQSNSSAGVKFSLNRLLRELESRFLALRDILDYIRTPEPSN